MESLFDRRCAIGAATERWACRPSCSANSRGTRRMVGGTSWMFQEPPFLASSTDRFPEETSGAPTCGDPLRPTHATV